MEKISKGDKNTYLVNQYHSRYKEILHGLIIEYAKYKSPCSILDIGCRWGGDLQRIATIEKKMDIWGVDLFFDALKAASEKFTKHQNVSLVQAKGEDLPFKKNHFDIIYTSEVIEHIENVEKFIDGVYRILKKDGIFILTTPSRFNYTHLIGALIPRPFKRQLRRLIWSGDQGREDVNPHVREYLARELKKILQRKKFKVEKVEAGVLRVPILPLFIKLPLLLSIWKCVDKFVGVLPGGSNLKHNFVMVARKS